MMWGSSPVLRGEDEPETFSCQLYFLPRELLFNVSWKKKKRKEVERRNNRWIKEEQRWVCSLNSGSWHNIYNFSVCECVCLSLLSHFTYTHAHTNLLFCWMSRNSFVHAPWCAFKGTWHLHKPLGNTLTQSDSLFRLFWGVIADWSHETCEVSFLSIHF